MAWGVLPPASLVREPLMGTCGTDRWFVRWMTASAPLRTLPQVNGLSSTQGEGAGVATPSQVSVWIGLDVGKESHFADVLDDDGERLFSRAISNDQGDIEALLDRAGKHGVPGLVIDQPGSIA